MQVDRSFFEDILVHVNPNVEGFIFDITYNCEKNMIFPLLFACSEHDLKSLSDDIDTPIEDGDAINFEPTEEPNIYVDPPLADFGGVMKDCPSDWLIINIQNRLQRSSVISSPVTDVPMKKDD